MSHDTICPAFLSQSSSALISEMSALSPSRRTAWSARTCRPSSGTSLNSRESSLSLLGELSLLSFYLLKGLVQPIWPGKHKLDKQRSTG